MAAGLHAAPCGAVQHPTMREPAQDTCRPQKQEQVIPAMDISPRKRGRVELKKPNWQFAPRPSASGRRDLRGQGRQTSRAPDQGFRDASSARLNSSLMIRSSRSRSRASSAAVPMRYARKSSPSSWALSWISPSSRMIPVRVERAWAVRGRSRSPRRPVPRSSLTILRGTAIAPACPERVAAFLTSGIKLSENLSDLRARRRRQIASSFVRIRAEDRSFRWDASVQRAAVQRSLC